MSLTNSDYLETELTIFKLWNSIWMENFKISFCRLIGRYKSEPRDLIFDAPPKKMTPPGVVEGTNGIFKFRTELFLIETIKSRPKMVHSWFSCR